MGHQHRYNEDKYDTIMVEIMREDYIDFGLILYHKGVSNLELIWFINGASYVARQWGYTTRKSCFYQEYTSGQNSSVIDTP